MTRLYTAIISILVLLAGCKSSKNLLERGDQDKAVFDAVKFLNKKSTDENAIKALPVLYSNAEKRHLDKIGTYRNYTDISRFDKLLSEYDVLQRMFESISGSDAALQYVHPISYHNEIAILKEEAAEAYYAQGDEYLKLEGRDNAKISYESFIKAEKFVSNYKDARAKKSEAYENGIVDVVINPVHDNSFFFNSGWGNTGNDYNNQYFQRTLINELGSDYASRYPARFYTEWDARRKNIQPDWVIDLSLKNLLIPQPTTTRSSRSVSNRIEVSKDTSGKPVYQTVQATITTIREYFTARGEMEVTVHDIAARRNIVYNTYSEEYRWEEQYAEYTGDSRALNTSDYALMNNRNYVQPRKEDVLNELYKKLYPDVKNRISYAVGW